MCYLLSNLLIYLTVVLRKRRRRSEVLRQRRPGEWQKWEFRRSPSSKVKTFYLSSVLLCETSHHSLIEPQVLILVFVLYRDTVGSGPANLQQPGGEVTALCWAHRVNPPFTRSCTSPPSAGATRRRQWDATTGLLAAHSCTQRRWEKLLNGASCMMLQSRCLYQFQNIFHKPTHNNTDFKIQNIFRVGENLFWWTYLKSKCVKHLIYLTL